MSTIAIAGASGTIGKLVTHHAEKAGHKVVQITRKNGIDLLTGEGLSESLSGVDSIIDVSQVVSPLADDTISPIVSAAKNLLEEAEKQQVNHVVMLSINGVQKAQLQEFPFYKARYNQENLFLDSALTTTVVRSTQWFEFALNPAAAEISDNGVKVQNWAIQPAAMDSVAKFLVETAEGQHGEGLVTVAGSKRITLPELTQQVLDARGDNREITTIDAVLPALADGSLFAPDDAIILEPSLEDWLGSN